MHDKIIQLICHHKWTCVSSEYFKYFSPHDKGNIGVLKKQFICEKCGKIKNCEFNVGKVR